MSIERFALVRPMAEQVPAIRLVSFRVALGVSLLIYFHAQWIEAPEWLTAMGFHASEEVLRLQSGAHHAIPLLNQSALPWFELFAYASLLGLILFPRRDIFSLLAFLATAYFTMADPMSAFTLNLLFTFCLFVLSILPIAVVEKNTKGQAITYLAWPLRLLQFTLISLYFLSGWDKAVFGDWLDYPDILWTQVQGHYRTDLAALLLQSLPWWAWTIMQVGALVFELSSPLIFIVRKFRPFALIFGVVFHILIAVLMHKLIYFSLQILSMYVLFIDPERLQKANENLVSIKDRLF